MLLGLIIGLFAGVIIGFFLFAVLNVAKESDGDIT